MAQLSTKIKLYCEANSKTVDFTKDVLLQDDSDGKGPYMKEWNVSGLDKPTDEQLAAQEPAGNTEEANNTVRATRKAAYEAILLYSHAGTPKAFFSSGTLHLKCLTWRHPAWAVQSVHALPRV